MLNSLDGKGLIIHHWDTDGISSTTLLLQKLNMENIGNATPTLGNYYLTNEEINGVRGYDFLIIVDLSIPEDNIKRLHSKVEKILIFDHHLGSLIPYVFHYNPIIKGEDPSRYPSASWIINEYLGNPLNLYSILGVVGDHEGRIKNNPVIWNKIEGFCKEKKLSFDDLLRMVALIDSNYKLGKKNAVEEAPWVLLEANNPQDILGNSEWNENLKLLEDEINSQLSQPLEVKDGVIIKRMNTPYNIISTVTRRLAWGEKKPTIVINTGFFKNEDQFYARSLEKDLKPLIERGKNLGFKCGGKKEVLGAIIPKDKTEEFLLEVIDYLRS
ncbi:MAG TPA: DHH family phosphoesterase [Thermoplasmatales archaeon]|nr:DHH family phosphoesterase [Thermoplasmatales archaeon]